VGVSKGVGMTRLRADLLILLAAMIWGTAFVAQKAGLGGMGPLTFIGGRFAMSALLLTPLVRREAAAAPRLKPREWLLAGAIGVIMCLGAIIQQFGLITTTVTNAGFITTLYIGFVPFVAWAVLRTRIRPIVLVAVAVSLAGAWLLAGNGKTDDLRIGDLLILVSAVIFSLHIVLVSLFLKTVHRPFFLAFSQYAITAAIAGSVGLASEVGSGAAFGAALPAMLYTGLLSGGVGFTLQIVAQRYTPATEAALIMSLESVFAAVAGAVLLGDRLSLVAMLGCGLILSGVVMIEVVPALSRRRPSDSPDPPIGTVPLD
jgi:drug/metabolite transporter (DMT)-like permease